MGQVFYVQVLGTAQLSPDEGMLSTESPPTNRIVG